MLLVVAERKIFTSLNTKVYRLGRSASEHVRSHTQNIEDLSHSFTVTLKDTEIMGRLVSVYVIMCVFFFTLHCVYSCVLHALEIADRMAVL